MSKRIQKSIAIAVALERARQTPVGFAVIATATALVGWSLHAGLVSATW